MLNDNTQNEIEKIIKELEDNLLIFNYGDLAFDIAIITRLEKLPEDISLKDFYRYLLNNSTKTISIKAIGVGNESNKNGS